jgi:catechol 2,3-dioxygenase-like lactoylglutathione lyase family enzyme
LGGATLVSGLSHITLVVENLNRSAAMLAEVFGAEEIYSSGDKRFSILPEKFFLIGDVWLCLMEGNSHIQRSYNHIAFKVEEDKLHDYRERIEAAGLELESGRPRVTGEGQSLYFYDYDHYLWELHTSTLEARLQRYLCDEPSPFDA